MINFNTFSTRKQTFISIQNKLKPNNKFEIKFQGFDLISSLQSENAIFLYYKSNTRQINCSKCQCICKRNKGYKSVFPLIAIYNNKPIIAKFDKTIALCTNCNSQTVQAIPSIESKQQVSLDIRKSVLDNLNKHININYTTAAKLNFISLTLAIKIFDEANITVPSTQDATLLAVDEVRLIPKVGNYQFVVNDLSTGDVIQVLENRESKTVVANFIKNYSNVKVISQDLWSTYKNAAIKAFKDVTIIADMFHVVRQVTWAFNRSRVDYFKHNGNKTKLRWRSLTMSVRKFDSKTKKIIKTKLSKDKYLEIIHQAKEMFMYACRSKSKEIFNRVYEAFKRYVRKYSLQEFEAVIISVENWKEEILNAIETGYSNGMAERRNSDIKQLKRNARGFQNIKRTTKLLMFKINKNTVTNLCY